MSGFSDKFGPPKKECHSVMLITYPSTVLTAYRKYIIMFWNKSIQNRDYGIICILSYISPFFHNHKDTNCRLGGDV